MSAPNYGVALINFTVGSATIICNSFFILFYFYEKKVQKPSFLKRCVLHLLIFNSLRELMGIIDAGVTWNTPISDNYCYITNFLNAIFRMGELFTATILSIELLYLFNEKLNKFKFLEEKHTIEISWVASVIIAILCATIKGNVYYASGSCSTIVYVIISQVLFWIATLIHTTIFCYIIIYAKYKKYDKDISILFYLLVFISFGYLRAFYFIYELLILINGNSNLQFRLASVFFSAVYGGITSVLFSYNLGYFKIICCNNNKPAKQDKNNLDSAPQQI